MPPEISDKTKTASCVNALTPELLRQRAEQMEPQAPEIKREKPRQEVFPDVVELQLLRHRGMPIKVQAHSRDISETGIGIRCRQQINADELVELRFHLDDVLYATRARVVHCTQTLGGYKVGLQFMFD